MVITLKKLLTCTFNICKIHLNNNFSKVLNFFFSPNYLVPNLLVGYYGIESSLGPSWAPSETIHNINFCVTLVSGNFLFRTCVAQYAPYTTVSEHGEYYFIEFFSSVRDTCRRYSRFWPQVSIFVGLKRGGKKGKSGWWKTW